MEGRVRWKWRGGEEMEPFTGHSAGVATARPTTAANTLQATNPQPLPRCKMLLLICPKAGG